MDLVQHAYDADAAAREREEAENKKLGVGRSAHASAGAAPVAADGGRLGHDLETARGILGALARLAFSPSRASDASGRGSG